MTSNATSFTTEQLESLIKYQTIFENAAAGILESSPDGVIQNVNAKVCEIFGYQAQELIGQNLSILLPPEVRGHHSGLMHQARSQETSQMLGSGRQLYGINKAGDRVAVNIAISRVKYDQKISFIATILDTRKLDQQHQDLSKANRLLNALKRATERFVTGGLESHVLWDELLNELLHITNSEYGFIGEVIYKDNEQRCLKIHAITNISWDADSAQLYERFKRQDQMMCSRDTMIGQVMYEEEVVISNEMETDPRGGHTPHGHPALKSYLGVPIIRNDKLVGVYGVANSPDAYSEELVEFLKPFHASCAVIIEGLAQAKMQQQLMEQLEQARQYSEQTAKMRSDFMANMSHEIRTPLHGILGLSNLALATESMEKQREYADKIYRSSELLLSVVNDILDFSKLEAGRLELDAQAWRLEQMIEEMMNVIQPIAFAKGLKLDVVIDPALNLSHQPSLQADVVRLKQVLLNLLGNAVKFTQSGYVQLRVEQLACNDEQLQLAFRVKDTGIGIALEQQSRIFEPFLQEDASISRSFGGTGLGLSIAQKLVEQMQGRISVSSKVGRGSEFTVELPLPIQEATRSIHTPYPDLSSAKIVVFDFEPHLASNQHCPYSLHKVLAHFNTSLQVIETLEGMAGCLASAQVPDWCFVVLRSVKAYQAVQSYLASWQSSTNVVLVLSQPTIVKSAEVAAMQTLIWPILPMHLYQVFERKSLDSLRASSAISIPDLKRKRILVAEDNAIIQQILFESLEKTGATLTMVENGERAVQAVEQSLLKFDLVLMDLEMPMLDGYSAANRVRELGEAMPIIAMSAYQADELKSLSEFGFDQFLAKPVLPIQLYQLLTECLNPDSFIVDHHALADASVTNFEETLPKGLSGANLQAAKSRMRASENFYEKMLYDFVKHYATLPEQLEEMFIQQQGEEAYRLLHSFKNLSLSLGLNQLGEQANYLQQLSVEAAFDKAQGVLAQMSVQWQELLVQLEPFLHAFEKWQTQDLAPGAELDADAWREVKETLMKYLGSYDARSVSYMREHKRLISQQLDAQTYQDCLLMIENFDFSAALELLQA